MSKIQQRIDSSKRKKSILQDSFLRTVDYLRLSITDRCDYNCSYCMPEVIKHLDKKEVLTIEELFTLSKCFIELGIKKIRITGGEPLIRKGCIELIEFLNEERKNGLSEICLTTNGSQLYRLADKLAKNKVDKINVSLDTLEPNKFAEITKVGKLEKVLAGIDKAIELGLKIKLNTVALKNFNEDQFEKLIDFSNNKNIDIVFIEVMPMGDIGTENRLSQFLNLQLVFAKLNKIYNFQPLDLSTGGPSKYYSSQLLKIKVGFITPLSQNFCSNCNRIRLTCSGKIYSCLGYDNSYDLSKFFKTDKQDIDKIKAAIKLELLNKPIGHNFAKFGKVATASSKRHMSVTGG